jgi:hypothetical protein
VITISVKLPALAINSFNQHFNLRLMQISLFYGRAWMSLVTLYRCSNPQTEVWGWFCSLFLKSAPAFRLVITISYKITGFSH